MKRMGQSLRIVAGLALLAILILIATYEYQTLKMEELPFETIEQAKTADVTKQWKGTEPRLLIVAHPEDISEAQQYVTDKATVVLSRLDFTKHFAIIAFQGWQGVDRGGPFQIERIVRQGNVISLYAQPINRDPSVEGSDIVVSPYHLVKVRKDGMGAGIFNFKLYFDKTGSEVTSISFLLP
jgi:hypothetical protein